MYAFSIDRLANEFKYNVTNEKRNIQGKMPNKSYIEQRRKRILKRLRRLRQKLGQNKRQLGEICAIQPDTQNNPKFVEYVDKLEEKSIKTQEEIEYLYETLHAYLY